MARPVGPETTLGRHRALLAKQSDGYQEPAVVKLAPKAEAVEKLVSRLAGENRNWGCRRLAGALKNLGQQVSPQTVANIL